MSGRYKAPPIVTFLELEQLAGVEDRTKFWKQFIPTFQIKGTDAGMKAFGRKCRSIILKRVRLGEISLCDGVQP